MKNGTQQILEELKEIKSDLKSIKENMPDRDMFLTAEEEKANLEKQNQEKSRNFPPGLSGGVFAAAEKEAL